MANRIRRDDTVVVISGKDKGKRGKVLAVLPSRGRAIVEGVNMVKKHARQRKQNQPGGIINREAPIHMSNLLLYCQKCGRGVRTGSAAGDDGSRKRICRKCGEQL